MRCSGLPLLISSQLITIVQGSPKTQNYTESHIFTGEDTNTTIYITNCLREPVFGSHKLHIPCAAAFRERGRHVVQQPRHDYVRLQKNLSPFWGWLSVSASRRTGAKNRLGNTVLSTTHYLVEYTEGCIGLIFTSKYK